MGILRFVLALSVVMTNVGYGRILGDSRLAVQSFFMISGFLISFVLNKDNAYSNPLVFYMNRGLRIFPAYWIVLATTAGLWLIGTDKFSQMAVLNWTATAALVVSNLIIFGQDAIMFLQQQGSGVALTYDFQRSDPQLWKFLLVPQAWSLSLELTFYAIAPFILRRRLWVVGIAVASLCLTALGWHYGLSNDPWTYRFFPFEISLFLIGALAERYLLPLSNHRALINISPIIACVLFIAHGYLSFDEPMVSIITLCAIFFLLPFLFKFQHGKRWDVLIGDLSYPLYICHLLVVGIVNTGWSKLLLPDGEVKTAISILAAIVAAVILERFVAQPIERLRKSIRTSPAPVDLLEASQRMA